MSRFPNDLAASLIVSGMALCCAALVSTPVLAADQGAGTGGDKVRGQDLWESRCVGCHSLEENRVGPKHRGVFGRVAGTASGFSYSSAVKNAGYKWDEAKLDAWLTNPQALLPGQRMNFRIAKPEDRADIIAYLKSLSTPQ